MPGALLCCSTCQAHRRALLTGVLLCRSAPQSLKRAPWMGSYFVVHWVRLLMGQSLSFSSDAGMWGERGYGDGSTHYAWLAVSPCFHGCLAFLHRHFPPQSPPSHPLDPSLHSQQQPSPWDSSQTLNSSSQPLCLRGDLLPCPGYV